MNILLNKINVILLKCNTLIFLILRKINENRKTLALKVQSANNF